MELTYILMEETEKRQKRRLTEEERTEVREQSVQRPEPGWSGKAPAREKGTAPLHMFTEATLYKKQSLEPAIQSWVSALAPSLSG